MDVATRAGVAKSTVSNVLTGKKFVSDDLKARVLKACEELDYHPNFYASALSTQRSRILALLLESSEDIEQKMYKNIIVSCIKEASQKDYSILVYYDSDKGKLMETLRRGCAPIDGAVIMSPCLNDQRFAQFDSQHINFVVMGRPEKTEAANYVDVDNTSLTRDITSRLVDFTRSKDVYLINSNAEMTISQDRRVGFLSACSIAGVEGESRVISREAFYRNADREYVYSIVKRGSVFITSDDIVAKEVYRIAAEKKLYIGEDVSVFALGRSIDAGTFEPPLSYAKQDYSLLAKTAVDKLISLVEGEETDRCTLISAEIKVGQSVKKHKS